MNGAAGSPSVASGVRAAVDYFLTSARPLSGQREHPPGVGAAERRDLRRRVAPGGGDGLADRRQERGLVAPVPGLRAQGARQVYFKICSTFDSTDRGNIGPVAEALQAFTQAPFLPVTPAFPEAGRTVFKGHLFVGVLGRGGSYGMSAFPRWNPRIMPGSAPIWGGGGGKRGGRGRSWRGAEPARARAASKAIQPPMA